MILDTSLTIKDVVNRKGKHNLDLFQGWLTSEISHIFENGADKLVWGGVEMTNFLLVMLIDIFLHFWLLVILILARTSFSVGFMSNLRVSV